MERVLEVQAEIGEQAGLHAHGDDDQVDRCADRDLSQELDLVRVGTAGVEVIDIDAENNLLMVKGSIPGSRNSYVTITKAF